MNLDEFNFTQCSCKSCALDKLGNCNSGQIERLCKDLQQKFDTKECGFSYDGNIDRLKSKIRPKQSGNFADKSISGNDYQAPYKITTGGSQTTYIINF